MTQKELADLIRSGSKIALDLGCGPSKKAGYMVEEKLTLPGVDFVADMETGLSFLPDNSVDEINSSHFFELNICRSYLKMFSVILLPARNYMSG